METSIDTLPTSAAMDKENVPAESHKLKIILTFLIITIYWAVNSFRNERGILHGARWMLSIQNLKTWLGFGPQDLAFQDECRLGYEEPLKAVRTVFGGRGTIVYGWPSKGGLWVHDECYGVGLNFLGLSRFEPSETERYSKEEDEFCQRLERIGGRFFESESAYYNHSLCTSYNSLPQVWYGWPGWPDTVASEGVWTLRTQDFQGSEIGVSRIRNALNMEERCKAIEMLGGKFYQNWEDVPKLESESSTESEGITPPLA